MSEQDLIALLPYALLFISAAVAYWNGRKRFEQHRREVDDFQREVQMQRRATLSSMHTPRVWHSDGQRRRFYYEQSDFGLDRIYDTEYEKPKREPRYALGDDGELIPVTGDEKPKRGAG